MNTHEYIDESGRDVVEVTNGDHTLTITHLPEDDDHEGRYLVKAGRYGEPFYLWAEHMELLQSVLSGAGHVPGM